VYKYTKEGTRVSSLHVNTEGLVCRYSINKTGAWRKMCTPGVHLGQMRQVDWAAAQHLLSSFSCPFGVKLLYDHGFRALPVSSRLLPGTIYLPLTDKLLWDLPARFDFCQINNCYWLHVAGFWAPAMSSRLSGNLRHLTDYVLQPCLHVCQVTFGIWLIMCSAIMTSSSASFLFFFFTRSVFIEKNYSFIYAYYRNEFLNSSMSIL